MTAPTLARPPAAEIQRLRAEVAAARREIATLRAIVAAPDPTSDLAYWRALFADGHRADCEAAWRDGYAQAGQDEAALWRQAVEPVAYPERGASRRMTTAISGERRDRAEHERAFVARAYNTPDRDRTDAQRATVRLYRPPGRTRTANRRRA